MFSTEAGETCLVPAEAVIGPNAVCYDAAAFYFVGRAAGVEVSMAEEEVTHAAALFTMSYTEGAREMAAVHVSHSDGLVTIAEACGTGFPRACRGSMFGATRYRTV